MFLSYFEWPLCFLINIMYFIRVFAADINQLTRESDGFRFRYKVRIIRATFTIGGPSYRNGCRGGEPCQSYSSDKSVYSRDLFYCICFVAGSGSYAPSATAFERRYTSG